MTGFLIYAMGIMYALDQFEKANKNLTRGERYGCAAMMLLWPIVALFAFAAFADAPGDGEDTPEVPQ